MKKDIWHFERKELAEKIMGMFDVGISNALVLFAPRRMGKTEFLCKDITPLAKSKKWSVFYFSFFDAGFNPDQTFIKQIAQFAKQTNSILSTDRVLGHIKKISAETPGVSGSVEFTDQKLPEIRDIFSMLQKKGKILLLLDEVQILTQNEVNKHLVGSLRTALDMHKDEIKVIFTGSSREGLRRMFSSAQAPFFHFGLDIPFPSLGKEFAEHLSQVYFQATSRKIDSTALFQTFVELGNVTQLARLIVEKMILNPGLELSEAKQSLLLELSEQRAYADIWQKCSALEKLILKHLSVDGLQIFSESTRKDFAIKLGIDDIPATNIQSSINALLRRLIIGRNIDKSGYYIEDPNFKIWIIDRCE